MLIEALLLLIAATLYWFLVSVRPPPKLPPGPRLILPGLGSSLSIGGDVRAGYQRLRETYGDVFSVHYGPRPTVVICDFDLIQEVGNSPDFTLRPVTYLLQQMRGGTVKSGEGGEVESCPGVFWSRGQCWSELRRFTLHNLRDLGFGKRKMDQLISDEISNLCDHLEGFDGAPVLAKTSLNLAVVNSLWQIVAGAKLDYDDPKMVTVVRYLDDTMRAKGSPFQMLLYVYKPLARLALALDLVPAINGLRNIYNFIQGIVKEHKDTFQEDNLRDFTDVYIQEQQKRKEDNEYSPFVGIDGETNLVITVMDLFVAGSETTSNTLNWAMLLLLKHPKILSILQDELDAVTGRARMPTYEDRHRTPFAEAVVAEVQRVANITPRITHVAARDSTIGGGRYFIPKGCRVTMNVGSVMNDPRHFPDPKKFDPTRHLNEKGEFCPDPKVAAFGLGRRRCLGEGLAKTTLYVFLTGLVSRFDLKKESEEAELDETVITGRIVDFINPVKMRFIARK